MGIIRLNELPEGSGNLTNDDIFVFMDNPGASGITRKISLSELSEAIGTGSGGLSTSLPYLELTNEALIILPAVLGGPGKYGKLAKCRACDKINQRNRYLKNREARIQKTKEYKIKNKEHNSKVDKKRYLRQRESKLLYQKQQREAYPGYMKEYRIKNKEKIRQTTNKWQQHKYNTDLSYRLRNILQKRIVACIRGHYKSKSTIELLGCSIEAFKKHLESQFYKDPRISWETYGPKGWHIDHIMPCASFDLTDPEQQKSCFHYTNMQPLWWDQNIAKSDSIPV